MSDHLVIPRRALNDRRVRNPHIRALAAVAVFGGGRVAVPDLAQEAGIDVRDMRRLLAHLEALDYLQVERTDGKQNSYRIVFSDDGVGQLPRGGAVTPPSTSAPLCSPPKPPTPPSTPPIIPPPSSAKDARGTRLPLDWQPSVEDLAYAEQIGVRDIPRTIEDFRDYWHARAGPDARKANWPKTWQRWCRTTVDRQGGNGKSGQILGFAKPTEQQKRADLLGPLANAAVARSVVSGSGGSG